MEPARFPPPSHRSGDSLLFPQERVQRGLGSEECLSSSSCTWKREALNISMPSLHHLDQVLLLLLPSATVAELVSVTSIFHHQYH